MKIGDKVSVLDEDVSGEIIAVNGNKITLLDKDGFECQYTKNEIVIMNEHLSNFDFNPSDISEILSEKNIKKKSGKIKIKTKDKNIPPMEIDLHINQLVSNSKGMDNYDMLTLQLDTAKRQLEFAISKRLQRVVFIHGVGDGVLRTELEYLLKKYDQIKFYDADYQKYGIGATEVYIFQNSN